MRAYQPFFGSGLCVKVFVKPDRRTAQVLSHSEGIRKDQFELSRVYQYGRGWRLLCSHSLSGPYDPGANL
jgi:hypothetical protein